MLFCPFIAQNDILAKERCKIEREIFGRFLFVFHGMDRLDSLVGRRPHAWAEKGQSHGNHKRDKSGISAETVSAKGELIRRAAL